MASPILNELQNGLEQAGVNDLIAQAGHDINLTSTTRGAASAAGASSFERTTVD